MAEIAGGLDSEPELGALFEKLAKFKRHFGRDAAAAEHGFFEAAESDANGIGEGVLGDFHGDQKVFEESYAKSVGWYFIPFGSNTPKLASAFFRVVNSYS